jgi:hypothetical protein
MRRPPQEGHNPLPLHEQRDKSIVTAGIAMNAQESFG